MGEFQLENNELSFETPLPAPHLENNTVHGTFYPLKGTGPAVVVLPQWNAKGSAQDGLCRLLNLFGMAALKLNLPYHGPRMPAGLMRADYTLVGRKGLRTDWNPRDQSRVVYSLHCFHTRQQH
jgi:hypothetical protein